MKTSILKLAMFGFASIALTGCISTTSIGAGSDRKQLIMVSQEHVVKKADKDFAKSLHRTKGEYWYREKRLVGILNTLIPYADQYSKDGEKIEWAIHTWPTKKLNAGALANGVIIMSQKIENNKNLTDSELAFIIAHEMAHVVRQHHRESTTFSYVIKPALIGTALLASGGVATAGAVGHDIYGNGFRRVAEKEADLLGLEIYTKAGYSPDDAISVLQKFGPLLKEHHPFLARIPSFLSSHPSFKQREKQVRKNYDHYKAIQAQHVKVESDNLITWDFESKYRKIDNFTVLKPVTDAVASKELKTQGFASNSKLGNLKENSLHAEKNVKPIESLDKPSTDTGLKQEMEKIQKVDNITPNIVNDVQATEVQALGAEPSV